MTVYVVDLESIPTRYTCEWKTHIPSLLKRRGIDHVVIEGPDDIPDAPTPGMFLNFPATNIYKAAQVEKLARLFSEGAIKNGDQFLFTDAWHPGVINLRYMADLMNIDVTVHGMWHAGSYDPNDGLGRTLGDTPWVRHAEKSMYYAYDHNWFATVEHIELFNKSISQVDNEAKPYTASKRLTRTGWPMEYLPALFHGMPERPRRDMIVFPHRIAPEKQVDIFRDLAKHLPEYEFVVCQDQQLTKREYHEILGQAKMVFSANLQETLGITVCGEGPAAGAIPFAPSRLTYKEIFQGYPEFLYPSNWTESWSAYVQHRDELCSAIRETMKRYDLISRVVSDYNLNRLPVYFTCNALLDALDNPTKGS